jgi:hypothetical protein
MQHVEDDWIQQSRSNTSVVEAEIERLKNAHGDRLGLCGFDYATDSGRMPEKSWGSSRP